jgi:hypothetical protein
VPKPPGGLIEFLYEYAPPTQSLALGARALVLSELAPCHEYIFKMRSKVVMLYGPTERVIADAICSIGVFARHVTLAFHDGAHLRDPDSLLRGGGKRMRHVALKTLADLDNASLRRLIRQARRQAGVRRPRGTSSDHVVTRIKTTSTARRSRSPWDMFGDDSR